MKHETIHLDQKFCTACYACVVNCPRQCITMKEDMFGFLRPEINDENCIACGKCVSVCQEVKKLPLCLEKTQKIYAAKHRSSNIKKYSSSGGVFTALSDYILREGGVIVGAVYADNMQVVHTFAETSEERDRMRGSKYTYSFCDSEIYKQIKTYLNEKRRVLFTGTPCQTAALKQYIGKLNENLITVDLLCHGIAAPVLYREFVNEMQKKGKIVNINFRYHRETWHTPQTEISYENGKKVYDNSYFELFTCDGFLRESCYQCQYASFNRISDLTMGDFWGIERFHKEFDAPDGVSVLLVNTDVGKKLLAQCRDSLELIDCVRSDCLHEQLNGLPLSKNRNNELVKAYLEKGSRWTYNRLIRAPFSIRIRERLYRIRFIREFRDYLVKKCHHL